LAHTRLERPLGPLLQKNQRIVGHFDGNLLVTAAETSQNAIIGINEDEIS